MPNSENLTHAVRQLLVQQKSGTLASHSIKHPGYPFCSSMPFAISILGTPLFLVSSMATHTRNLKANPNASLLVTDTSNNSPANGRVTLIGQVELVAASEIESARDIYLALHPDAKQWAGFGDFAFYQLNIVDIYIVAGFGSMGWVKPADYLAEWE